MELINAYVRLLASKISIFYDFMRLMNDYQVKCYQNTLGAGKSASYEGATSARIA